MSKDYKDPEAAALAAELREARAERQALAAQLEKKARTPAREVETFGKGVPHVTTGAVYQDSKRFSLTNWLVNGLAGRDPDRAKFEMDAMRRLQKAINESNGRLAEAPTSAFWLPLSWDMLGDEVNQDEGAKYCKAVMSQSGGYDPDEARWLALKGLVTKAAQSAYDDRYGGTIVAPPVQGEIIPLIRPNAAFLAAGAQIVALPPQGRYVRPRVTSATVAQALGEAQTTGESSIGTDQMVLQAKKIAGAVRINEEATAFTSGTIDTLAQADLATTLGLKLDAYAFYGPGTNLIPAGLTADVYSSAVLNVATTYSSAKGIGANGNDLLPQYGDQIPTLIEERSYGMDGTAGAWVMRPAALSRARSLRGDAVAAGDQAGPFVDILRKFQDSYPDQYAGRKVVKTTNLKNNLTKGTASDLSDVFYGLWQYAVMGAYGAVQFTQGHDGNSFLNGQYLVRGVMYADIGFLYPAAFAWYTKVRGASGLLA